MIKKILGYTMSINLVAFIGIIAAIEITKNFM